MKRTISGFTIVELLIVIVVIAILAAISIVAYTGIQNRANDTSIQADLNNISKKMGEYKAYNERYPLDTTELETLGLRVSKNAYETSRVLNLSYCAATGGVGYAIGGISKSGKRFFVSSQSSVTEYPNNISNDGNASVGNPSCTTLLTSSTRISAGYYSSDPGLWRAWTGN